MKTPALNQVLTSAVDEVIVKDHLEEALRSQRKLRVKFGIDPTSPDLHLGHTVPLRKLKQFQDLGHKAVLIIGDFTAMVGDPSGRSETRRPLSPKEVKQNMKKYLRQAGKIMDLDKAEVRYNSEWYAKAGMNVFYDLLSKVTVQRALERDDFQKRLKENHDITLLEAIYPLLQGYDSVAVKADAEIGGSDQKFNMLMGRKIQRRFGPNEQDIMTVWLIEGTDGKRKMSKSFGNYIGIEEKPVSMFGKLMSIPDELMVKYFTALTDVSAVAIKKIERDLVNGNLNPRDAKLFLAETIVGMYRGRGAAEKEREQFIRVFSRKELPQDLPQLAARYGRRDPVEFLLEAKLAPSKSEARRLIRQGAVEIDGEVVRAAEAPIRIDRGTAVRVGKKRFARVK